ncbi:PAS domain S-box protein [Pseudomaricurvus alkylphenolicus]|uniref:two-component system sensor histidine kinase NtrB n=1 Tax=Pseudomaricurvus alkylphenolicus TaxID=1306991 RepID=UPI0014201088|nr:PAS domain S-box protein [Pseudomaricurvus alkylphenolicus]NIB41642.1 PAS domain S-box protein [Pseudomaricurvus alkylphenolicus]
MKQVILSTLILLHSQVVLAGITDIFKDEEGNTNWQHLANWTSGTLIILLTIVVVNLFITRNKAHQANRALEAIRNDLELRVQERTATLDEANQKLTDTNKLLEDEVSQHVITSQRLRASESYIKNILTSMPLMLIGLDEKGQITQWNQRAEEVSGHPSDDVMGKNLWEAYPVITISPDQVKQAMEKGEAVTIKHSQRGRYHYDITIYPLQGQVEAGVVILVDDVTKRVKTENRLIQRDKMSSMGELAATMAQDIDTPLQAIFKDLEVYRNLLASGALTVNGEGNDSEVNKLDESLADALDQGRYVASVIGNLLAFARSRNDEKQAINVPEVMDHSLKLASEMLSVPSKLKFEDIEIERNYEEGLPQIQCYVFELQQVFLSLFRHALGQMPGSGREPKISIRILECYDAIWIQIQHNGIGLTSEEQQYLFEPFFGDGASEDDYDIGKRLSFSHFIVSDHHQGEMAVTSDVEVGSTFHMQIPIDQ